MDCHGNRMASCCLLLFFVFLKLISLSEEGCYDYFSRDKWNGADVTDLIPVINTTSLQGTLKCTLWKNKERKLFQKIRDECYEKEDLEETCNKATYHTMYMFHFRCLFAKLENVNCTGHTTFGDCQNFSSVVETMEWLWRISDGTSAGATSTSPPTMSTLTPITTSTISTPNISTSPNKASLTTNSTTTSTSPKTITSTASPTTMSMSLGTTTSTASPTTSTSASDVGPRKDSSTETPAPLRGHSTSILVLLILSITANIMQWLNSFLQKRRLKKKQKQMPAEYISLNPDAAAAENSPEKSLSYSNETVN
ncbi:location of vulva defective 1-like isoform X3 [Xiphophorus maculatus]|uniref:location of vulva defective 1-like isoform X3 n=1 Tax=Xiphophorus maculatus TaxID=8083 RepID=UPI000C6D3AAF|nr:location of vulva defective 1-like isoform X3 [Xiphophorus maculatus]